MRKELDFKGVNAIEFHKRFTDDAACYEYLSIAKWPDNNFTCKKCGFEKYCNGKKPFLVIVYVVNMMKAQLQALPLIKLNFHCTWRFISYLKHVQERKDCQHWNYQESLALDKRFAGHLNGKYNK